MAADPIKTTDIPKKPGDPAALDLTGVQFLATDETGATVRICLGDIFAAFAAQCLAGKLTQTTTKKFFNNSFSGSLVAFNSVLPTPYDSSKVKGIAVYVEGQKYEPTNTIKPYAIDLAAGTLTFTGALTTCAICVEVEYCEDIDLSKA